VAGAAVKNGGVDGPAESIDEQRELKLKRNENGVRNLGKCHVVLNQEKTTTQ